MIKKQNLNLKMTGQGKGGKGVSAGAAVQVIRAIKAKDIEVEALQAYFPEASRAKDAA